MKVNFSKSSKLYLSEVKEHIAKDSPKSARSYISNLIHRITSILAYPQIGKINKIYNDENIREVFIEGYKVIYKVNPNSVSVLMIYKNIDFDEKTISF